MPKVNVRPVSRGRTEAERGRSVAIRPQSLRQTQHSPCFISSAPYTLPCFISSAPSHLPRRSGWHLPASAASTPALPRMVLVPARGGEPWLWQRREGSWRWRTSPHDNIFSDEQRPPENERINAHGHRYQTRLGAGGGCLRPSTGAWGAWQAPAAPHPAPVCGVA